MKPTSELKAVELTKVEVNNCYEDNLNSVYKPSQAENNGIFKIIDFIPI